MTPQFSKCHLEAIEVHALRRYRSRCGVDLPAAEYRRSCGMIAQGGASHVAVTGDGHRVFHVRYGGASGYGVWRSEASLIATFYPCLEWVLARGGYLAGQEARVLGARKFRRKIEQVFA